LEQGSFKVKRLTLYLNSYTAGSQRGPNLPERIEMYEWQTGKWQMLSGLVNSATTPVNNSSFTSPGPKPNDISDPSRYVDPQTGRVLLRFSIDNPNLNVLTQFNLAVDGNR